MCACTALCMVVSPGLMQLLLVVMAACGPPIRHIYSRSRTEPRVASMRLQRRRRLWPTAWMTRVSLTAVLVCWTICPDNVEFD